MLVRGLCCCGSIEVLECLTATDYCLIAPSSVAWNLKFPELTVSAECAGGFWT